MTNAATSNVRALVNLASGYSNVALMALITLLVTPIYVRVLGSFEWATVALCMTLQGVLFSIDLAIAPMMLRDVARAEHSRELTRVVLRFLRLYVGVVVAALVAVDLVFWIWRGTLHGGASAGSGTIAIALHILLFQFACQFTNNAALGYWHGRERQRFANRRVALFLIAKHGLALFAVHFVEATAVVYLLPFAVLSAIELIVNLRQVRQELRRKIDAQEVLTLRVQNDGETPPANPGFFSAFARMGIVGALVTLSSQIDRVLLALLLPSEQYGTYFLISTLVLSVLSLQVPIFRAFLPQISASAVPRKRARGMMFTTLLVVSLPCLAMALVPELVLRLWLRNESLAAIGADSLQLMLIGVALMATYSPINALLVSMHRYSTMTSVAVLTLLLQVALLVALFSRYGMYAAALAWFGCGVLQCLAAVWLWWHDRRDHAPPGVGR